MLWATVHVILTYVLATTEAGKARIRDLLASTICSSMKAYSSTKQVVGLLKTPNQFSDSFKNCKICRDVRRSDCKSNECQKFYYVPCTNQEIPPDIPRKCFDKSTRIINGRDVYPNELPFLVNLERFGKHHCGGSIYNQDWIITAAHCVTSTGSIFDPPIKLESLSVLGGDLNRSIADPTQQRVKVKSIVAHEKYNDSYAWQFDIALIEVYPPFKFDSAVSPICLASQADEVPVGQQVRVSGWGTTNSSIPTLVPEIAKTVQIKVISLDECHDIYIKDDTNITQGNMCAVPELSTPAGSCFGDSGGPLFMDKSGSRFLVGLVSGGGGPGCSTPDAPSYYSSIACYHDWIVDNAGDVC